MGSTDRQPESTLDKEGVVNSNGDLVARLKNWVKERPITLFTQRRVRQNVANAITTDILHSVGKSNIPERLKKYRGHISDAMITATGKLSELPREGDGIVKKSPLITDSVTGTRFFTRIKREGGAWISEEIDDDGKVISQAKIGDGGELSLTLNFADPRYEQRGANPKLENDSRFPTGTKVLFLNHAASLGVISWKGK